MYKKIFCKKKIFSAYFAECIIVNIFAIIPDVLFLYLTCILHYFYVSFYAFDIYIYIALLLCMYIARYLEPHCATYFEIVKGKPVTLIKYKLLCFHYTLLLYNSFRIFIWLTFA